MSKEIFVLLLVCLMPAVGLSDENKEVSEEEKVVSGMSIVGNDEAPKSLVIVPWKSSDLGGALDVSRRMDDGEGQSIAKSSYARSITTRSGLARQSSRHPAGDCVSETRIQEVNQWTSSTRLSGSS